MEHSAFLTILIFGEENYNKREEKMLFSSRFAPRFLPRRGSREGRMMERSFFMGIKTSLQSIGIRQALGYLERNPEENLPKLMAWVVRFAGDGPDSFPSSGPSSARWSMTPPTTGTALS